MQESVSEEHMTDVELRQSLLDAQTFVRALGYVPYATVFGFGRDTSSLSS
jgi:hypothetical protein